MPTHYKLITILGGGGGGGGGAGEEAFELLIFSHIS